MERKMGTAPVTTPYLGRVLGKVLGTMSKVDLGVGRARVRPRAASGSPPGSGRASRAATACRPQAFQATWCQLGYLLVVMCMLACRAGVRACDAARGVSSGGRGHGQAAGIAGSMIVGDPDRGEGAIVSTRRHGYRLSVIGYRLSVIGYVRYVNL